MARRVFVSLDKDEIDELNYLRQQRGGESTSDAIRHALKLAAMVYEEIEDGRKLAFVKGKDIETVRIL